MASATSLLCFLVFLCFVTKGISIQGNQCNFSSTLKIEQTQINGQIKVAITNMCECAIRGVIILCPNFNSPPNTITKIDKDHCLIDHGLKMYAGYPFTFTYAPPRVNFALSEYREDCEVDNLSPAQWADPTNLKGDDDRPTSGNPDEWVIKMEEKESRMEPLTTKKQKEQLERNRRERLCEFYKSEIFRRGDELVTPERVSMRGRSRSREEQEMKEASLLHFLRRSGIKIPLQIYLNDLSQKSVFEELKKAWEGVGYPWEFDDTQHFVRMMLLNGAFLLEFMRAKRNIDAAAYNPVIRRILEDYDETKRYQRDFLLMGNQLPLLVLQRLLMVEFRATRIIYNMDCWIGYLTAFAETFIPINRVPRNERMYSEFISSLHLLDLYRRCLVHRDFKRATTKRRKSEEEFYSINNIPSATELRNVGIGFTISGSISMLDVCLQGKTLMLPEIVIDGSTRSSFFNLITFEKLHRDVTKNEVASYLYFMRCLILVADDVSLLQSCGIIITTLPPAEVADLFNKMIKDISLDRDDPLAPEIIEAFTMVRERYNQMAAEWRKDLFQTYLKSPWAIMSVVAAILLFTLSFIQTFYTVLGYVHPK